MSQSWLPSYVRSGLSFARRNGGKIALFTMAAGSALAATAYMRRQLTAVNASVEHERIEGARRLRAVFVANSQTVKAAFCSLIPLAREVLLASEQVNSASYVEQLRNKPKGRAEKRGLWEEVKVASITHLVSAVYIAALLHSFLLLQMNLLARYTNSNLDAPVQPLPRGALSSATSKRYLDLSRSQILRSEKVKVIVQRIKDLVRSNTQTISLTERIGIEDVECVLANILGTMEAEKSPLENTRSATDHGDGVKKDPLQSVHIWLLSDCIASGANEDQQTGDRDLNFEWLVQESMDLCDVLDFQGLVESSMYSALAHALSCLKEDLGPDEPELPFAHFLARFDRLGSDILSTSNRNSETDDGLGIEIKSLGLDQPLSETEDCARFAASVFLSGEKERSDGSNDGERPRQSILGFGIGNDDTVASVSRDGGEAGPNDMGLMFDIN